MKSVYFDSKEEAEKWIREEGGKTPRIFRLKLNIPVFISRWWYRLFSV